MSTSWSCELELRKLADDLHGKAYELEKAADVIKILRESPDIDTEIKSAKTWAKSWLKE